MAKCQSPRATTQKSVGESDISYKLTDKESISDRLLVLLCYKFQVPQKGQRQSFRSRERASKMRSVAMEYGLCRCGRMRASGLEVGRDLGS
jgi:hypothetical protein